MISIRTLRARANAIARSALAPVPLGFWQSAFPKDVIALCYHVVSDRDLPHLQLYPYKNTAQFEADVIFARERALTYGQVADRRTREGRLARNGILFTFDDGLAQCYDAIRPILKRHGVDGVFFVTTDYLDDRETFFECELSLCLSAIATIPTERISAILERIEHERGRAQIDPSRDERARRRADATRLPLGDDPVRGRLFARAFGIADGDEELELLCTLLDVDVARYAAKNPMFMSREQIRTLVADGFTIGAHGRKHRSLEGASIEDVEREIVASCEAVRAITGRMRVPFAFPYSGLGIDRCALAGIMRRNPIVELIFDSGCLRNDRQFVVNRVFADSPALDATRPSNVPQTLRGAWSVPSAWFRTAHETDHVTP